MLWVFLAISANFVWAFANLGDKYIVSKRMKDPYVYMVLFVMAGACMSVLLIPFINFHIPEANILFLLILCAAIYFYAGLPYIRAMQIEEATRVNIWWNMIPIFSLLIGWMFFDEVFGIFQLTAFLFLVTGAFLASVHVRKKRIIFSRATILMIIASFGYALYAVIFHHAVQHLSFLVAFVWIQIFMCFFAFTLFLYSKFKTNFKKELRRVDGSLIGLIFGVSFLDNFGMLLNQWALVFGVAALVYAFEGSQTIFVFILAILFSIFFPKIIKEELDRRNILLKLASILLMVVGVIVLSLG